MANTSYAEAQGTARQGTMMSRTVTLSHEQIKSLFAGTLIPIVPSPGAGKLIAIVAVVMTARKPDGAYTLGGAANDSIYLQHGLVGDELEFNGAGGLLDAAIMPTAVLSGARQENGGGGTPHPKAASAFDGLGLYAGGSFGTTITGGGGRNNSVTISVAYMIVDI